MRYLLFFIIVILTSCGNENNVTISEKEYKKLTGDTSASKYPKPFRLFTENLSRTNSDGIVPASDGHEYLVCNYMSNAMNIEHYIDCEKCKTK